MKRSPDNQIYAFLIDILRIKWLVFFVTVVFCYGRQLQICWMENLEKYIQTFFKTISYEFLFKVVKINCYHNCNICTCFPLDKIISTINFAQSPPSLSVHKEHILVWIISSPSRVDFSCVGDMDSWIWDK